MNDIKIVIVEDDISALESLTELLKFDNFDVTPFDNPSIAMEFIRLNEPDIVISDIKMPDIDGLTLLERIKSFNNDTDVILMTAFGDVNNAVEAIKKGATNYILKPINYDELKNHIVKISEVKKLKNIVSTVHDKDIEIIAISNIMKKTLNLAREIAKTDSTVLIEGETGTGKELISRFIHKNSLRKEAPFLPVNCAALPKDLLESELFGFEKGSFTGATHSRRGKFLLADKGTIFLDEISEMDYEIQAKLLRVLEDGIVERLGSEKSYKTDIRIFAATNKNLEKLVKEGKFRKDLYFRLNVLKVELPCLKEREEDIKPLIDLFIKNFSKKYSKKILGIDEEALKILKQYEFPGNVRELKHIIERGIIISKNEFLTKDDIFISNFESDKFDNNGIVIPFGTSLKDAENKIIIETLKNNDFNKNRTAGILGISVRKIEMRFKEMGISLQELKYKFHKNGY